MFFFVILHANLENRMLSTTILSSLSGLYSALYEWYAANKRVLPWRETQDPYCIWLSEIILQQTRVAQGLEYYMRFMDRFPTVQDLAAASEDEVLVYWQGLGYYSRARNLHKAAQMIGQKAKGERRKAVFPTTFEQLRQLPGVGDYTAGAIASFAYNLPYPAMDGNVYRVVARLSDTDEAFDTTQGKKHFHQLIEQLLDRENPRLFNSAIMEFGALYCTPTSPDCETCPLQHYCLAYAHHTVELLPVRKPRPKVRDRWFHYRIYIDHNGLTLIHQRQAKDIWQHLWEFVLEEYPDGDEAIALQTFPIRHILSHQRLHARMDVIKVTSLPSIPDTVAVDMRHLGDYAMPQMLVKVLEQLSF